MPGKKLAKRKALARERRDVAIHRAVGVPELFAQPLEMATDMLDGRNILTYLG